MQTLKSHTRAQRRADLAGRNPLLAASLSRPHVFAGSIDASHDRIRPTARTVCQAFGPYASAAYVEPLVDRRAELGHRVATIVSSIVAVGVLVAVLLERFA